MHNQTHFDMDYKKLYDKALELTRQKYEQARKDNNPIYCIYEEIFPELRESEDERIRKWLIDLVKKESGFNGTFPSQGQILAYLEKQKESLHVQEICKENADSFTSEDERIRKEIIDFLETIPASELKRIPRPINEWFAWLEKQKESHIPWYDYQKSKEAGYTIVPNEEYDRLTKPAEWSEEDERMTDNIVSVLGQFIDYKSVSGIGSGYATPRYTKEIDWLKSLRPQKKEDLPKWRKMPPGYEIRHANVCSIAVDILDVNGKCVGQMGRTVLQNGNKYLFLDDLEKLPKED